MYSVQKSTKEGVTPGPAFLPADKRTGFPGGKTLMKQLYAWKFEAEELQIIKSALLKFDKRSPHYDRAQQIASQLPVQPVYCNDRQEGLTADIIQALRTLGKATAPEIEKHLRIPKPNSVSAICSRLAKQGLLIREPLPQVQGRGVSPRHTYSVG